MVTQERWHWRYWSRTRADGSETSMTEVYKWDHSLLVEVPVAECEDHEEALEIVATHNASLTTYPPTP